MTTLISTSAEHIFRCTTRACHTNVTFKTADAMEAFVHRHKTTNCPTTTPKITLGRGGVAVILSRLWPQVDSALDSFLNEGAFQGSEFFKGQLTGMCHMIYEVSIPYFATVDDVKQEAMARREARLKGETRITPGVANITIHPEEQGITYTAWDGGMTRNPAFAADPPPGYPEDRVAAQRAAYRPPAGYATNPDTPAGRSSRSRGASSSRMGIQDPLPLVQFTDEQVTKIKTASEGGFDNKMLAQAYNCTVADIARVLAAE